MKDSKMEDDYYGFKYLVYEGDVVVPTVTMGNGSTMVCTLVNKHDNVTGVCFSDNETGNTEIGQLHDSLVGRSTDEIKPHFQILFDNPNSIDVVINSLNKAKEELLKKIKDKERIISYIRTGDKATHKDNGGLYVIISKGVSSPSGKVLVTYKCCEYGDVYICSKEDFVSSMIIVD